MRLSLYLHIPFCVRKCLYCDFNSESGTPIPHAEYVRLLIREMELRRAQIDEEVSAPTLYLGGGTPSLLEPALVAELLEGARRLFPLEKDAEVTLEANPGTVTRARLEGYRAAGINRLSLGVQSFDDRFLAVLGRVHSGAQALEAYGAAREAGFTNVSIDLMHSLPGQERSVWEETVRTAVRLAPEHVSAYALTVEPATPFGAMESRGELPLPEEEEAAQMFEGTVRLLAEGGYRHYEISNFARPGFDSRHNGVYWSRGSYLGLGAGAHSFLNTDGLGRRWHNPEALPDYCDGIARGIAPEEDLQLLSLREAISESFFLGLRRLSGVDLAGLEERYPARALEEFLREAQKLVQKGQLQKSGHMLSLSPSAVILANTVFCRFL